MMPLKAVNFRVMDKQVGYVSYRSFHPTDFHGHHASQWVPLRGAFFFKKMPQHFLALPQIFYVQDRQTYRVYPTLLFRVGMTHFYVGFEFIFIFMLDLCLRTLNNKWVRLDLVGICYDLSASHLNLTNCTTTDRPKSYLLSKDSG